MQSAAVLAAEPIGQILELHDERLSAPRIKPRPQHACLPLLTSLCSRMGVLTSFEQEVERLTGPDLERLLAVLEDPHRLLADQFEAVLLDA